VGNHLALVMLPVGVKSPSTLVPPDEGGRLPSVEPAGPPAVPMVTPSPALPPPMPPVVLGLPPLLPPMPPAPAFPPVPAVPSLVTVATSPPVSMVFIVPTCRSSMDVRKQASPASDNTTPMAGHRHSQIMGANTITRVVRGHGVWLERVWLVMTLLVPECGSTLQPTANILGLA
jgi:hypothetical protein